MGGLSEDLWISYVSLGKLQRRMMTVLYILSLREKLQKMFQLAHSNLQAAQST